MFLVQYWGGPADLLGAARASAPADAARAVRDRRPVERDAWLRHMRDAVDSLDLPPEQEQPLWRYLEMAAHSMQNRRDSSRPG